MYTITRYGFIKFSLDGRLCTVFEYVSIHIGIGIFTSVYHKIFTLHVCSLYIGSKPFLPTYRNSVESGGFQIGTHNGSERFR